MSVFYRLNQDKRRESATNGKWFARSVALNTIDTEALISEIEKHCTVTDADVVAVVKALIFVINKQLQNGNRVKLNGMGAFTIGLKSKGADSPSEFTASKHIVGSRVNFRPETHWTAADGNRRRKVFLEGLKVEELPLNTVVKDNAQGGEGNGGN